MLSSLLNVCWRVCCVCWGWVGLKMEGMKGRDKMLLMRGDGGGEEERVESL